jgi:hypothetical protein
MWTSTSISTQWHTKHIKFVGYKTWLFHHHLQQQQNSKNLKNDENDIKHVDLLITLKWNNTSRLDALWYNSNFNMRCKFTIIFIVNILVNRNLGVVVVDHAIELLVVHKHKISKQLSQWTKKNDDLKLQIEYFHSNITPWFKKKKSYKNERTNKSTYKVFVQKLCHASIKKKKQQTTVFKVVQRSQQIIASRI